MDSWYRTKFDDLNNKSTKQVDKARSIREEIVTAKKDVCFNFTDGLTNMVVII